MSNLSIDQETQAQAEYIIPFYNGVHFILQLDNLPTAFINYKKITTLINSIITNYKYKLIYQSTKTHAIIIIFNFEIMHKLIMSLNNYEWFGNILSIVPLNNFYYNNTMINPMVYGYNWYQPNHQYPLPFPQPPMNNTMYPILPIPNLPINYSNSYQDWNVHREIPKIDSNLINDDLHSKFIKDEPIRSEPNLEKTIENVNLLTTSNNTNNQEDHINSEKIDPCKLFIGNIPFSSTWKSLKDFLKKSGINIKRVEIPININNGIETSKGFAIVQTTCKQDSVTIINRYDGSEFEGRILTVRFDKFPDFNNYNFNSFGGNENINYGGVPNISNYQKGNNFKKNHFMNVLNSQMKFNYLNEFNYHNNYYNPETIYPPMPPLNMSINNYQNFQQPFYNNEQEVENSENRVYKKEDKFKDINNDNSDLNSVKNYKIDNENEDRLARDLIISIKNLNLK